MKPETNTEFSVKVNIDESRLPSFYNQDMLGDQDLINQVIFHKQFFENYDQGEIQFDDFNYQ